jgi:hypothetical protein
MILKKMLFLILTVAVLCAGPSGEMIAPGVWHFHDRQEEIPLDIHVITVSLNEPSISVESAKAGNQLRALEKTSSMAARTGSGVIAAVNADFFQADGMPVGAQVMDGELLKNPVKRSVFGITRDRVPFIDIVQLDAYLLTPTRVQYEINYINGARNKDNLVIYTPFMGSESPANRWGTELTALYIDNPVINDMFRLVIVEKSGLLGPLQKRTVIPENGVVLSAHGKAKRFVDRHIEEKDTLSIIFTLPPVKEPVQTLVGGIPRIIRDGQISIEHIEEFLYEDFRTTRHPRTAVGFNKAKDTLYIMTVDGRQPRHSVGMSLDELAEYMSALGAYQAVNLDGGGSTTMVLRGKVANKPSDTTGERAVTNALLVLSKRSEPIQ